MTTRPFITGAGLILCALAFAACSEGEIALDYSKALYIKVAGNGGSTVQCSASSLFDSIASTPIYVDNNTLISKIDKAFFVDDMVIVVDQRVAKRILAYAPDGQLLFEFQNVNKTPFTEIGDVIYIKEKGLLEVYDAIKGKILSYNARTGALIRERATKLYFLGFYYLGSNSYAYYTHFNDKSGGSIKHNLVIEDSLGNFKKFLPYYNDELTPADVPLNYRPFFSKAGRHYLAPYCSKYIYEITPQGVTPAVNLDFGVQSVDLYGGLVNHDVVKAMDTTPQFAGDAFLGKDNNLYFTYLKNKIIHGFVQSRGTRITSIRSIKNDLSDVPLQTNFVAQTDSFVVQSIDLEEVNAAAEEFKYEAKEVSARMKAVVNKYPPGSFLIQKLYFRL